MRDISLYVTLLVWHHSLKWLKRIIGLYFECQMNVECCPFILSDALILYNLTNLRINRVCYFLPAFLPGFCCGNSVAFSLNDVFEFFIFLKKNCLLLHGKVDCSAGFLHVCDWSDAANTTPFMWARSDQDWKTLGSITELITSFVVQFIRFANVWVNQTR